MHVCRTCIKSWKWNNFGAWRGQSIHPAGECVAGYVPVQSALDEKKRNEKKRKRKERNYLFTLHSEMFSGPLSRLIHVSSQFLLPFLNLT